MAQHDLDGEEVASSTNDEVALVSKPGSAPTHGEGSEDFGSGGSPKKPHNGRRGNRAQELISRELLDELSHEPEDWNEGGSAPTPPMAGFETPSEPGTPRPHAVAGIETPRDSPYCSLGAHKYHQEIYGGPGPMCMDPWDWKTDAPEFVPGVANGGGFNGGSDQRQNMNASPVSGGVYLAQGTWTVSPAPLHGGGGGMDHGMGMQGNDWQVTQSDSLREMHNRMNQLEIETAQAKAIWEHERRNLVKQISHYRALLERYCIPLDEAGTSNANGCAVDNGYGENGGSGNFYGGFDPTPPSQWGPTNNGNAMAGPQAQQGAANTVVGVAAMFNTRGGDNAAQPPTSSLDSKMRQLNNLLQESGQNGRRRGSDASEDDLGVGGGAGAMGVGGGGGGHGGEGGKGEFGGYSSGSIASTLRSMFPHAKVRTSQNGEVDPNSEASPVIQQLRRIEKIVGGAIDERALRALQTLGIRDGLEALVKVEELVQAQGGQCRNLSSILQSVCRKIEKRGGKGSSRMDSDKGMSPAVAAAGKVGGKAGGVNGGNASVKRARHGDEDGDALDGSDSGEFGDEYGVQGKTSPTGLVRTSSVESDSASKLNTPAGRRSNRSWADIQSGDEEDPNGTLDGSLLTPVAGPNAGATDGHMNPRHVEKIARRGFDLRRRGEEWQLKISMAGVEPRLTEAGMELYCRWLRVRLTSFQEEHGEGSLRRCRGEVDFSHNGMSNEMLWMLLETFAQFEVQTASLKLFANRISRGGVLAICEFIRMNKRADAIQELHLSHNEIDDESALELMRTLHTERPRYPPHRVIDESGDSVGVPVWLRLNHNWVRDPDAVRRSAEHAGISVCPARDRNACGTTRCCRQECPLVHLHSFNTQACR